MQKSNQKSNKNRQHRWKKENKRNYKKYRKIYEDHIGRKLTEQENIHHIDLNRNNNDISNLHLFPDQKTHTACHVNLENIIKKLIKDGIITFDKNTGQYSYNPKDKLSQPQE